MKPSTNVSPQNYGIDSFKAGFNASDKLYTLYDKVYLDDRKINGDDLVDAIQFGPVAATALIDFINKAKNIGKEWDDLDDQELQELQNEFGDRINDPNWQQLFNSLLGVSVAIDRIAESRKAA